MKINYWVCKFHDYEEIWDGENEDRYYWCTHKKGNGCCIKNNKYGDAEDECKLAELEDEYKPKN
jgi:hypothetical protein